jgi:hypothetical protein
MTTKRAAKAKKADAPAAEPKRPSKASPTRGAPAKRRPAPSLAPTASDIDLKVSDTNLAWLEGLFGAASRRARPEPRASRPRRDTLAPPPNVAATAVPHARAAEAAPAARMPPGRRANAKRLPPPEERPTDPPAPSPPAPRRTRHPAQSAPQSPSPLRGVPPPTPEVEMQKPEPVVEVLKPKGPRRRVEKPEPARPEKKEVVVRVAQGMRKPKVAPPTLGFGADADEVPNGRPNLEGLVPNTRRRGAVVEINPRLQRSRPVAGGPAESPPPVVDASGKKVMSVAMKHRAAAEAMFSRLTADGPKPAEALVSEPSAATDAAAPESPKTEEPPLPFAARSAEEGGGSYSMRVSERDVLVTQLRLATDSGELLAAARALVERFALPADQAVLLKVIPLGDDRLTQVALEELLELQDRGRVRANPELMQVVGAIRTHSPEVADLKTLLLQKLGARG